MRRGFVRIIHNEQAPPNATRAKLRCGKQETLQPLIDGYDDKRPSSSFAGLLLLTLFLSIALT